MTPPSDRDGYLYTLHFERGELVGEMKKTPADRKKTGSSFHWLPDLDVFTDIDIPKEYYEDTLKRQAVVNAGITFRFRCESAPGKFDETEYFYENGILDYIREITAGPVAHRAAVLGGGAQADATASDMPMNTR